jgi:hypothetical protein
LIGRDILAFPHCPRGYGVIGHKQIDEGAALLALTLIVEGNSIRSASRITGLTKRTITKLVVDAGQRCDVHRSIKATPAMVSGVAAHRWTLAELLQK